MFKLDVENKNGQMITLTQNETEYQVVDIEGLNPPNATINRSFISGMDGSKFNSAKLDERNLVITLRLNGNVERNRINLYRYFKTKQWCKIHYENGSRNVFIEGYVETIEVGLFTQSEIMQISIICNDPYFKDMKEIVTEISKILDAFEFPFAFGSKDAMYGGDQSTDDAKEFSTYDYNRITAVFNESETEIGALFDITFIGEVVKPSIKNTITGEIFEVYGNYDRGDRIIINTNKGSKSVRLYRNGKVENLFPKINVASSWFQLEIGVNHFTHYAERNDAFMKVSINHRNVFEGV